jgi:L-2-hydroxyglutarate oxidase LhgO
MSSLLAEVEESGGFFTGHTELIRAEPIADGFIVWLDIGGEVMQCRYLINSAGLSCIDVAKRVQGLDAATLPELHWCKSLH